ncbi:MAG: hypothetical protein WCT50_03815 [Patescibacteria group bacterium]|jgi:hypothetical protein
MNIESLEFHIKSDDYFGTLATILNLLIQDECCDTKNEIIKNKVEELMYLQKNYKIIET